jgi:hypothetical protein
MVAASLGEEKWSRADSAAASVSSCSWFSPLPLAAGRDDPPVFVAPDVNLALPAGESAGLEDRYKRAETLAEATMSVRSSPGSRNTGTMIRATFGEPSRFSLSARPMFCTISTCEPRVSAKQTASTPACG